METDKEIRDRIAEQLAGTDKVNPLGNQVYIPTPTKEEFENLLEKLKKYDRDDVKFNFPPINHHLDNRKHPSDFKWHRTACIVIGRVCNNMVSIDCTLRFRKENSYTKEISYKKAMDMLKHNLPYYIINRKQQSWH